MCNVQLPNTLDIAVPASVVASKASDVQKGLEQLGMPVKMYDAYAKPVTTGAATTKVNVDAKTIIGDYLKAIGGAGALSQVKTISATGSMSYPGHAVGLQPKANGTKQAVGYCRNEWQCGIKKCVYRNDWLPAANG